MDLIYMYDIMNPFLLHQMVAFPPKFKNFMCNLTDSLQVYIFESLRTSF